MFLDVLRRRNSALIEQAIMLHQGGRIPADLSPENSSRLR